MSEHLRPQTRFDSPLPRPTTMLFWVGLTAAMLLTGCPAGDSEPDPSEPHALGVISIGESHASSGGTASASLSASFVPDAAGMVNPGACTREVAGCQLPVNPDCGGTCGEDQVCSFDGACASVCTRICDAECGPSQECYFPAPDSPACRERRSFDAGSLAFSGTTTPVTLFPPYAFDGVDEGSLFIDGSQITVQATGAVTAGYEPFEASFSATQLLRTNPPLHQLGLTEVFGTADISVQWIAGDDDIQVSASVRGKDGTLGSLTCPANDADGAFAIPRAAIDAALDGDTLDRISIAVTRRRTEMAYGIGTTGDLVDVVVQPTGWLELSTHSTETAELEGCQGAEELCGNMCIDTDWSDDNCGACGNDCGIETCRNGTCSGTASCNTCVNDSSSGNGGCASAYNNCTNDADCAALRTCIGNCTTAGCNQECANSHPDGINLYNSWVGCICNQECTDACYEACF